MMKKAAKGFTLIELMIVVAIIGILAAIAIPNFLRYQLRSRASERRINLEAIFKSQEALRQSEQVGRYQVLTTVPASNTNPGSAKVPWLATDLATAQAIDWIVQGSTYGAYAANTSATGLHLAACGVTDIDADGNNAADAVWNPSITAAGAVSVTEAMVTAPCAGQGVAVTGTLDESAHTITYVHGTDPMGRPVPLSAASTF